MAAGSKEVLDINKLNEIITVLSFFKFSNARWLDLAVALNLSYPVLKDIESNHKEDVCRCLLECLSLWLKSSRNWQMLIPALRSIGEERVADGILKLVTDPASQLLQQYSTKLSQTVLTEETVQLLHTEGVVSEVIATEVKKCGHLLVGAPFLTLCMTVADDHNKLKLLINVLQTMSLLQEMYEDDDYKKLFPEVQLAETKNTKESHISNSTDTSDNRHSTGEEEGCGQQLNDTDQSTPMSPTIEQKKTIVSSDNQTDYVQDAPSASLSSSHCNCGREHYYGIGYITKPIGVCMKRKPDSEVTEDVIYTLADDNYTSIGDLIKDQSKKVKVRPILVSFSGLPESGMSNALVPFLDQQVHKCPVPSAKCEYKPLTSKSVEPEDVGITQYDLIANGTDPLVNFTLSEAMKESYFTFGVLSAFQNILATTGRVPVLDHTGEGLRHFEDNDLNNFFMHMYQYLCNQPTIPSTTDSTVSNVTASGLTHSLPDCLTLVNIWDHSIKNSVRHLLSALQGHLYNHHMFLFLDLERDLNNLYDPLEIGDIDKEGAVFMKWRPRLHYLLRSAWATEGKGNQRRRVCTLFAKSDRAFSSNVKDDISRLEDHVKPVAKHIGVYRLLDRDIEVVNLRTDQKHMYRKIQHIASYTPPQEIPLSWLFLRSSFYHSIKIVISKQELKQKAKECGIDDESLTNFCKFYTSFGSIIDLSLANPQNELVIIKPVKFLKLLNTLLFLDDNDTLAQYSSIKFGIVPESYCKAVIGFNDWLSFMDAVVCLQLATRVTKIMLELPPGCPPIDPTQMYYYISLSCKGEPITEVDPQSVYLITNIDTPHFFKQVTIAEELLESMRDLNTKLYPCTNINQLIIKASDTTIMMSFHNPVIKIQLSDPNGIVCSHVVKAFHGIASRTHTENDVKVKYKFVSLCFKNEDIPNVASILSSCYHVLPHSGSCEHCRAAGRNDELLKVWNEALENDPIPEDSKPKGGIESQELSHIVDKMSLHSISPEVFAETFIPDCNSQPQFAQLKGERLIREVLFSWYEKIYQNRNDGSEPRRALAEKLSEVGVIVSADHSEPQRIRVMLETLAKRIDIYWKVKIFAEDFNSPLLEKDYEFLYQAMKSDHIIEYSVSSVVIQGEARVGKTCFKSLLLSLPYEERSTNCIEEPKVAFGDFSVRHYGHTGKCWKFVSDEEMEKKVLAELNLLQEIDNPDTLPNTSAESNDDSEESSDSDSLDSDDEDDKGNTVSSNSSVKESISDNVASEVPQQMSVSSKTSDDHNDHRSTKFKQSAVQSKRPKSLIKRLHEKYEDFNLSEVDKLTLHRDWLYFFDSGGQIQFQKLLPAFMPCTSNFILVINLAKSLSDHSSTVMQLDDNVAIESSSEYSLTVEDVLRQIFSAVVCRAHEHMSLIKNDLILSKYITPPPEKLNVITVATHCDKLEEKETQQELELQTKLNEIYDRLENKCKPAVYKKETSDCGSIFFKVDGRRAKRREYDDPVVDQIAEELKEHSYTIKVPLKWHCFLTLLRIAAKENEGVLHLSYCGQIGQELKMTQDEVVSMLKFFHILKLLFYFHDSPAEELVFVSLESVIDVIRQLVVDAYYSRSKPSIHPIRERRIGTEGIITVEVLRDKLKPKLKSFSVLLLKLFVHLLIAANIPKEAGYFMPALLPSFDTSKANLFPDVETVPLLFYFKNGVPMGLFCAMLVQLSAKVVSKINKLSWHIIKEDNFSNYFNLEVDEFEGSFILIEQIQCIEVHCDKTDGRVKAKDDIAEAINVVIKQHRFSQDDKPVETFYCSCKEKDITKHVVEWTGTKWSRRCSTTGKKQKEKLTEQYWSWFETKQQYSEVSNGIEPPDLLQNVSKMTDPHHEVVESKSNNGLEYNDTLVKADQVKPHHSPSSGHTSISTSSSSEAKPVPTLKVDPDSVRKKLQQVLTDHHVALSEAFKLSLKSIADELLQARLISRDIYATPSYDAIIGSFNSSISFKSTLPKLEEYCNRFFKALSNVGGPVTEAAQVIQEEWIETVRDELGIELQLDYL